MENLEDLKKNYSHIKGWGADIDVKNEPTYPMKIYTGVDHERLNWQRPTLQQTNLEILTSNERPYRTAVYGTPNPPTALSGIIRRAAFKKSESSYGHWLPLYLADRINVIEGIFDDVANGTIPNIWKEKGMQAEWKLRPQKVLQRFAVGAVVIAVLITAMRHKRSKP